MTPHPSSTTRRRRLAAAAVLVLAVGALVAWVSPRATVDVSGAACTVSGQRPGPVRWVIENREEGNLGAPGYIENVSVSPDFGVSLFVPNPLPNTGHATAEATTVVPPDFSGTVTLTFDFVWRSAGGHEEDARRDVKATAEVRKCRQPTTTTSTSTTTSIVTTTTAPPSSTTSTTSSTTSTTSTTQPETTTTTAPTTTSTTHATSTTTTEPTTTSTTAPPSSTTTSAPSTTTSRPPSPCEGIPDGTPFDGGVCLIPPVTVTNTQSPPAEPAAAPTPAAATPRFTG